MEHLIADYRTGFAEGYNEITREEDPVGVDFGIYTAKAGQKISETSLKESVWLLLEGEVEVKWQKKNQKLKRVSVFDENPVCFHLNGGEAFPFKAISEKVEWAVARATNENTFASRFYQAADIRSEMRGADLVQGACTRVVRTVFDYSDRPESQLVVGEVVNLPGRWSSYPPHHHDQPEIYHYRFTLPQGYGHAEVGNQVCRIQNFDSTVIPPGRDHAQVSAPGYGMYYLWIVRHLPGNPYQGFEFSEDHKWILDSKNQGWEYKK